MRAFAAGRLSTGDAGSVSTARLGAEEVLLDSAAGGLGVVGAGVCVAVLVDGVCARNCSM